MFSQHVAHVAAYYNAKAVQVSEDAYRPVHFGPSTFGDKQAEIDALVIKFRNYWTAAN